MQRADQHPVAGANGPLERVDAVFQHQVRPAGEVLSVYGRQKRLAVPSRRDRHPEHLADGRGQVECVDQSIAGCPGGLARPADDHRHVQDRFVGQAVIHVLPVVAERVAVVAGDDDDGLVPDAGLADYVQDLPDVVVGVADGGVVAVDQADEVVAGGDLIGHVGHGAVIVPGRVVGEQVAAGPRAVGVLVVMPNGLFIRPVGGRLGVEDVGLLIGRAVVGVHVPVVDVDKQIVLLYVAPQPGDQVGVDLVGALLAVFVDVVVVLGPADGEPRGLVAFGERREADGLDAVAGQVRLEYRRLGRQGPIGIPQGDLLLVGRHAVLDAESAAEEGSPRRQAWAVGCVAAVEPHAFGGQLVNRRRGAAMISVATQVVRPTAVQIEKDHSHRLSRPGEGRAPSPSAQYR